MVYTQPKDKTAGTRTASLAGMLDNLAYQGTILDVALDLFGDRALLGIIIGSILRREHDVNGSALAGEDLSAETLLAEIDGSAVDLIQQDGGDEAVDLQSELGALDDVEAADKGVDDD